MPMGSHAMLAFTDGAPDQRRSPRYRVLLIARLVTTCSERIVKLRDLSASGAMIEGPRIPPVGTDILLQRGSLEVFGRIVWVRKMQAGIEFDAPLTETMLWMQVNAPQHIEENDPSAPPPRAA
jgi:hypothetical protein